MQESNEPGSNLSPVPICFPELISIERCSREFVTSPSNDAALGLFGAATICVVGIKALPLPHPSLLSPRMKSLLPILLVVSARTDGQPGGDVSIPGPESQTGLSSELDESLLPTHLDRLPIVTGNALIDGLLIGKVAFLTWELEGLEELEELEELMEGRRRQRHPHKIEDGNVSGNALIDGLLIGKTRRSQESAEGEEEERGKNTLGLN